MLLSWPGMTAKSGLPDLAVKILRKLAKANLRAIPFSADHANLIGITGSRCFRSGPVMTKKRK